MAHDGETGIPDFGEEGPGPASLSLRVGEIPLRLREQSVGIRLLVKSTAMKHSKLLSHVAAIAMALTAVTSSLFAASHTVTMNDFSFSPSSLNIGVGDSVTWTNAGGTHTSTSGSPPGTADGLWTSGTVSSPGTFTLTFANFAPKTYPYYCTFHFGAPFNMTGSVTVTNTTYVVMAGNFSFAPSTLTIKQGDTVIWTNIGGSHTTTSGTVSGATLQPDALWNDTLALDGTFSLTFNGYAPRTYPYYCTFHATSFGMLGSLTVTSSVVPPAPTLSGPSLSAGPQFILAINGLIGAKYQILSSPDLLTWSPIGTNIALSATSVVTNLPPPSPTAGFYRILELP